MGLSVAALWAWALAAPAGAAECVITMATCPAHPRTYAVPRFVDADYQGEGLSNRDAGRCLARAREYHDWCGAAMSVRAAYHEGDVVVASATAGARQARVDARLTRTPLPSGYDTDSARLGTQNGWAPGAPRAVSNAAGTFAVLLSNDSRSRGELSFDLAWKPTGSSSWRAIARGLGPAASDPVLVGDQRGRLHVLFPASTNSCAEGVDLGNVAHVLVQRDGRSWRRRRVDTRAIFSPGLAPCGGAARTQRFGAAVDPSADKLHLVFYDLAGNAYRVGHAAFDLARLAWGPYSGVPRTGLPSQGAGYTYVAPGAPGEVQLITTNFDASNYLRVAWARSLDGGGAWQATAVCDSQRAGPKNCLTGDILRDGEGRVHLMFQVDAAQGGVTPLERTGHLLGRVASYHLAADAPDAASPIVDLHDPEGPSPDWRAALGELDGRLAAIGPFGEKGVGLWVSEDRGRTWRFKDLSPEFGPDEAPYQFRLDKRQYGSLPTSPGGLGGFYTDVADDGAVRTFEFQLSGLSVVEE
ncbi:MAG: hypothetical protein HY553_12415 [Elusimicrobia bacterium]|nr:hypothetical protein [Elusimicrobiota bacterium]